VDGPTSGAAAAATLSNRARHSASSTTEGRRRGMDFIDRLRDGYRPSLWPRRTGGMRHKSPFRFGPAHPFNAHAPFDPEVDWLVAEVVRLPGRAGRHRDHQRHLRAQAYEIAGTAQRRADGDGAGFAVHRDMHEYVEGDRNAVRI